MNNYKKLFSFNYFVRLLRSFAQPHIESLWGLMFTEVSGFKNASRQHFHRIFVNSCFYLLAICGGQFWEFNQGLNLTRIFLIRFSLGNEFVSITTSRQSLSSLKHTKKAEKYLIVISFKNTFVSLSQ